MWPAIQKPLQSLKFQSTRPQGARRQRRRGGECAGGFNPRARRGRDAAMRQLEDELLRFNPRARRGRDHQITT